MATFNVNVTNYESYTVTVTPLHGGGPGGDVSGGGGTHDFSFTSDDYLQIKITPKDAEYVFGDKSYMTLRSPDSHFKVRRSESKWILRIDLDHPSPDGESTTNVSIGEDQ